MLPCFISSGRPAAGPPPPTLSPVTSSGPKLRAAVPFIRLMLGDLCERHMGYSLVHLTQFTHTRCGGMSSNVESGIGKKIG